MSKQKCITNFFGKKNSDPEKSSEHSSTPIIPTACLPRSEAILDVSDLKEPNQPNIEFKKNETGRSFVYSWFSQFKWLHYDEDKNKVYCFTCLKAVEKSSLSQTSIVQGDAFTKVGYSNWKKARTKGAKSAKPQGFYKHEQSKAHMEATQRLNSESQDIIDVTSTAAAAKRVASRKMLLKILTNVRMLARQASAFRGEWNKTEKAESNSNFYQLLMLRGFDDAEFLEWLNLNKTTYTSPKIQNEMIEVFALGILKDIATNIQKAKYFTIMADETADVSNKEQVVICLRWVDETLNIHEDFIGLKPVARTTAAQIVQVIREALETMQLRVCNARGQCYDGASVMKGHKNGVATQFKDENNKCLFTHCYGHSLQLAVKDVCFKVKCLREAFECSHEICNLVKKSPQRETHLKNTRIEMESEGGGIHAFCPTRWTVAASTLTSIALNYDELSQLWQWSLGVLNDTSMKGRIIGIQSKMADFNFYFGLRLGATLLNQTDNLSKALQSSSISAVEGQALAKMVVETLRKDRSEESFSLFWEKVTYEADQNKTIKEPTLPRPHKMPKRNDAFIYQGNGTDFAVEGRSAAHVFSSPKEKYKSIYLDALDRLISSIEERFNQPDYQMFSTMESILIRSFQGEPVEENFFKRFDGIGSFAEVYKEDINIDILMTQLKTLPELAIQSDIDPRSINFNTALKLLRTKVDESSIWKTFLSEVITLLKLILVVPATNAVSERVFSALRRVKSYLQATMTDQRLFNVMMCHVHKEACDKLDIIEIANNFVETGNKACRFLEFGKFSSNDLPKKKESRSVATQI